MTKFVVWREPAVLCLVEIHLRFIYIYKYKVNEQATAASMYGYRTKESANIFSFLTLFGQLVDAVADGAFGSWYGVPAYANRFVCLCFGQQNTIQFIDSSVCNMFDTQFNSILCSFRSFFVSAKFSVQTVQRYTDQRSDAKVCLVKRIWQDYFLIYEN